MLLQFWLYSQLARIVIVFFAVCTGVGFFTSLQMLFSGFAIEIAALLFLCDVSLSQSVLRRPNPTNQKFLFETLLERKELLSTLISVAIGTLTTVILAFASVLPREGVKTYLFASLLLLQICILFRLSWKARVKPQTKKTLILCGVVLGVFGLLTLLSCLIPSVGALTGMGAWTALTAALLPLCPGLYFILLFLLPFFDRTAK
jgi:hypothetical protein